MRFQRIALFLLLSFVAGMGGLGPKPTSVSATALSSISAGGLHTCAVTTAGGVTCWGDNATGQLGDGTTTNRSLPVNVQGLQSGVTAVAAGIFHSCALTTAGGVKCWGLNAVGELGNGSSGTYTPSGPVDVQGLTSGVVAITAGYRHSCALTAGGGVKCWGVGDMGELGNGAAESSAVPVDVTGLQSGVGKVVAGAQHTCAESSAGAAKSWGQNTSGQLGIGTADGPQQCGPSINSCSTTPMDVSGLSSGVAALALGDAHSCALTVGGGVKCWGDNTFGVLGDGTSNYFRFVPGDASGLTSGVSSIAGGGMHTCARLTGGTVKCWGWGGFSQLGVGALGLTDFRATPTAVCAGTSCQSSLAEIGSISGGGLHTCALTTRGGVKCWGYNASGQLGDGTTTDRGTPVGLDTDRDGCSDDQELGTNQALGGRRNPKLFWDFFDTPGANNARDRAITGADIGRITQRYGSTGNPTIDPLSEPAPAPAYHTAFDRSAAPPGGDAWDSQAADGVVSGADIGLVVAQYGHSCV